MKLEKHFERLCKKATFANAENELFYLNTGTELYDFRKKRVWKCGFVKFKFPNLNELIKLKENK